MEAASGRGAGLKSHILIDLTMQSLQCVTALGEEHRFSVSTALAGGGEKQASNCTPRGRHLIRARIGQDAPLGAVFVGRRPSGEIYSASLAASAPARDWILTRILWLSGTEVGRNRLGDVDTMRRYIYIHGTPDTEPMGEPASHGCIRMRNLDVITLFALTPVGSSVEIRGG
jgi:L,D-transpeptidase YbiS